MTRVSLRASPPHHHLGPRPALIGALDQRPLPPRRVRPTPAPPRWPGTGPACRGADEPLPCPRFGASTGVPPSAVFVPRMRVATAGLSRWCRSAPPQPPAPPRPPGPRRRCGRRPWRRRTPFAAHPAAAAADREVAARQRKVHGGCVRRGRTRVEVGQVRARRRLRRRGLESAPARPSMLPKNGPRGPRPPPTRPRS